MRIVLDANIYISSLISGKGNPATIISKWLSGEFDVLISRPNVDEILKVTSYKRLQKKYKKIGENRLEFLELITEQGIWAEPAEMLTVVTADESDNRYLECAIAGGATYVVTADGHLLSIGNYQGINILTPAAFVALLSLDNS